MSEKLLPCPFCGSPAELVTDNDHHGEWFNLGCSGHWGNVDPDDACPGGRIWYTADPEEMDRAIAAWNARSLVAAVEVVRDALRDSAGSLIGQTVFDGYGPIRPEDVFKAGYILAALSAAHSPSLPAPDTPEDEAQRWHTGAEDA